MDSYRIEAYDYTLPSSLIASYPIHPKEDAKLLVYRRCDDTIIHTTFGSFLSHLPPDCAVLLNNTKVIKARIFGHKQSGGAVELLLNSPLEDDHFSVYIKGRVKEETVLVFDEGLCAHVVSLELDGSRKVRFFQGENRLDFVQVVAVLERIGHVPLPPYIKREDEQSDTTEYQTLFAKHDGAVAAPTASLHFSQAMLDEMCQRHPFAEVTLHVGAGTFKPVDVEDMRDHVMHKERYAITQEAQAIIESTLPILAVGTTVTRTVEHYVRTHTLDGECDLFLHPHNKPQRVSHLLTNFHLPKSTLLMLVASFVGTQKMHALYREAIAKEYRFFSYGDAMLII